MTDETRARTREINEWLPASTPASSILESARPGGVEREGYYGLPMLKEPTWGWEIALYFFLEGISSGSFLLASLADLFGRDRYRDLTRAGYYTALAALLPCPWLLIKDLGRPERFHHMLRVFKPGSPMNLGAWALTAFGAPLTMLVARQAFEDLHITVGPLEQIEKIFPPRVQAGLGIPIALTLASYPGVLLATTSNPLWSKSRMLGALFSASSINTGAAALSLSLSLGGAGNVKALERLHTIETVASACEAAALGGYLLTSKETAEPIVKGRYSPLFWLGAVGAGLVLPTLLGATGSKESEPEIRSSDNEPAIKEPGAPKKRKRGSLAKVIGSMLSLAGGLALKWAITYSGKTSAKDAKVSRAVTRPSKTAPGWNAPA